MAPDPPPPMYAKPQACPQDSLCPGVHPWHPFVHAHQWARGLGSSNTPQNYSRPQTPLFRPGYKRAGMRMSTWPPVGAGEGATRNPPPRLCWLGVPLHEASLSNTALSDQRVWGPERGVWCAPTTALEPLSNHFRFPSLENGRGSLSPAFECPKTSIYPSGLLCLYHARPTPVDEKHQPVVNPTHQSAESSEFGLTLLRTRGTILLLCLSCGNMRQADTLLWDVIAGQKYMPSVVLKILTAPFLGAMAVPIRT